MFFCRPAVSDRESCGQLSIQTRMRDERFSGSVHAVDHGLSLRVTGLEAKAHGAEQNGRHDLVARVAPDEILKEFRQPDMLADHATQSFDAVVTQNHPQFQGSKTPSELE